MKQLPFPVFQHSEWGRVVKEKQLTTVYPQLLHLQRSYSPNPACCLCLRILKGKPLRFASSFHPYIKALEILLPTHPPTWRLWRGSPRKFIHTFLGFFIFKRCISHSPCFCSKSWLQVTGIMRIRKQEILWLMWVLRLPSYCIPQEPESSERS